MRNDVEDRMQDAVGFAWRLFADHAQKGELVDDALLVHHARLRAIDLSRRVATGDGQRKRDVYDPRNIHDGKVVLVHLDADDSDPADIGLARATSHDPGDDIVSAIDLVRWLNGLAPQDRRLLELRAAGFTLEEAGAKLGVSASAVFARCRELGRELAERMGGVVEGGGGSREVPRCLPDDGEADPNAEPALAPTDDAGRSCLASAQDFDTLPDVDRPAARRRR